MAEEPKPLRFHEMWSAISPTDLGLKAGYWTGKEGAPLTFRPIVGWISIMSREVSSPPTEPPTNGLYPVILGDTMYPIGAVLVAHYCGVFLKDMSEADAKVRAAEWMKPKPGIELQPNMRGMGAA